MKKSKGLRNQIWKSPLKYKKTDLTLKDLENMILDIAKKSNDKMPVMIAGKGGKDMYVRSCLKEGMSMELINLSIRDNGDGTFLIGPINFPE